MATVSIKQLTALLIFGLGMLLAAAVVSVPGSSQGNSSGSAAGGVGGLWLDRDGKAGIEVAPCGQELCGNIVWLKDPLDPRGKPWTDMLNPDTKKRSRPVCGMQIIWGLKSGANGVWRDGYVYDPEEGKTFNVELSLADQSTLKVFGYAGVKLLSETMEWKRLPSDQPRCKA